MNWKKLSPYILVFLITISSVFAKWRFPTRSLSSITDTLGDIYRDAPYLIDGLLLIMIFVPLCRKLLHKRLGTAAATGLGFLLALSVIAAEVKFEFSIISDFGIPAVIIFLSLFGISLFVMLKEFHAGAWLAASLGWLVVVGIAIFAVPDIIEMLQDDYEVIYWILIIATIFFAIAFLISLFGQFGRGDGGGSPPVVVPPSS